LYGAGLIHVDHLGHVLAFAICSIANTPMVLGK
jgi:hypothetical protein